MSCGEFRHSLSQDGSVSDGDAPKVAWVAGHAFRRVQWRFPVKQEE